MEVSRGRVESCFEETTKQALARSAGLVLPKCMDRPTENRGHNIRSAKHSISVNHVVLLNGVESEMQSETAPKTFLEAF